MKIREHFEILHQVESALLFGHVHNYVHISKTKSKYYYFDLNFFMAKHSRQTYCYFDIKR